MAKSAPTIAISATPTEATLVLKYQDFRQAANSEVTKRITVDGSITDANIKAIVADLDMLSNAKIVSATLEYSRVLTGMNASAQNALERNISEEMELSFQATNPVDTSKVIERSVLIPSMVAASELTDGSPDVTNTYLADLVGTSGGGYADGKLSAAIAFKDAAATWHVGMAFIPSESHHLTAGEIVGA